MNKEDINSVFKLAVEEPQVKCEKGKYYEFKIFLETPYKWGGGYDGATKEEIQSNEKAFNQCFLFLQGKNANWKIQKGGNFESDTWFNNDPECMNGIEEIYAHPMELSGVLEYSTLLELAEFVRNSNFENTKLQNVRIFDEVKKYTYKEVVVQFLTKLDNALPKIVEKYGNYVPLNYSFEEFDFKFKEYPFAKCLFNKVQTEQKNFILNLLQETIRSGEKLTIKL